MHVAAALGLGLSLAVPSVQAVTMSDHYRLVKISTYSSNQFLQTAAEIVAYDEATQRLFVVNNDATPSIDVLDISDTGKPKKVASITIPDGGKPNSVAVKNGIVAVASGAPTKTDPGTVTFFNSSTGAQLGSAVTVGALPDMLTFTPDGSKVVVANEAESSSTNGGPNPEGSISIINVNTAGGPGAFSVGAVNTAGLTGFNGVITPQQNLQSNVRMTTVAGTTFAQDAEPEYIAISPDGSKAYVSLQEANSIAVVDLNTSSVTNVVPLGVKDHGKADSGFIGYTGTQNSSNKLDASDRDVDGTSGGGGKINIANWSNVFGMYMPDTVATYTVNGRTYLVTANEGDGRGAPGDTEFPGYEDETSLRNGTTNTDFAGTRENVNAGRLGISSRQGNLDADASREAAYAFGARSFSIWDITDPNAWVFNALTGNMSGLVYDSGDDFEQITAALLPANFNSNHEANNFDNRSDNKGPEPEALTIAQVYGRTFAFIGLERIGGIMIYDITDPLKPQFIQYFNDRDFAAGITAAGDLGPEGMIFIPAAFSPSGRNLLVVANEVSGTTSIYEFQAIPEPTTAALGLLALGATALATRRRR
jgi:YVTN family beta-propeller protein